MRRPFRLLTISFLFICLILFSSCGENLELPPAPAEAAEAEGGGGSAPPPAPSGTEAFPGAEASASSANPLPVSPSSPSPALLDTSDGVPTVGVGMDGFISANDAVAEIIFNELGIKLIPVNVREDDYDTLWGMIASGTLPDLLRINTASPFFAGMAEDNLLRDWSADKALSKYPALEEILSASDQAAAVSHLYGGQALFLPLKDVSAADPGRIYYRKDWLAELNMAAPETADEFTEMLRAFTESKRRPGLTLAGGVTYLVAMFGADPYGWINENDAWIPAYYSDKMIPGLEFARNLYQNGWLDFEFAINKANTAVNRFAGGGAGSLIRYGDSLWLQRVLSAFADAHGIDVREAFDDYVGVLPPFKTTEEPNWPRSIPASGIIMPKTVPDETAANALALLDFIITDEAAELARFGIRGETSDVGADGTLRLFIDPATATPFNIVGKYPSAQVLFLMGEPFSVPLPSRAQAGASAADKLYASAVPNFDDGYLAHFIHTPNRTMFEAEVNFSAEFNAIVMGEAPVTEMFASFKTLCDEKGIAGVIREVNERVRGS